MAFASGTFREHLARGAFGVLLIAAALRVASAHPAGAGLLAIAALVAFRGCPVCWTTGLVEMVALRLLRRQEHLRSDR